MGSGYSHGDYGDIMKFKSSGASDITAQQDGPTRTKGVDASHALAKKDWERMNKYKDDIFSVAAHHKVDPAVIAGIISRESRAGNTIKDNGGWGDHFKAWGLMQVDVHPDGGNHKKIGAWDSRAHLFQATGILVDFIKKIRKKYPDWSKEYQLEGGIAAYNCGDGKVDPKDADKNTTGGDYANDVLARAQWYREKYNPKTFWGSVWGFFSE
ncbi:lysozyme g-like [Labrus bergylta]|uniref:lysozyme g-like n=1 Tax=Labrus bergylta TaxID=56723 RepID=UPI00331368BE